MEINIHTLIKSNRLSDSQSAVKLSTQQLKQLLTCKAVQSKT